MKNSISCNQIPSLNHVKNAANCYGEFYHLLSEFNTENLHVTLLNFHNGNFITKRFKKALLNGE